MPCLLWFFLFMLHYLNPRGATWVFYVQGGAHPKFLSGDSCCDSILLGGFPVMHLVAICCNKYRHFQWISSSDLFDIFGCVQFFWWFCVSFGNHGWPLVYKMFQWFPLGPWLWIGRPLTSRCEENKLHWSWTFTVLASWPHWLLLGAKTPAIEHSKEPCVCYYFCWIFIGLGRQSSSIISRA